MLLLLIGTGAGKPAQGAYHADGRYVTIVSGNYTTWSSFYWQKRGATKKLLHRTFLAKGRYVHQNGNTYYSLYNTQGKWFGYSNAKATKSAPGVQGLWHKTDQYVTTTKRGYPFWRSFFGSRFGSTTQNYQQTYHATGIYYAANGSTYLSLYDAKRRWCGYLNQAAVIKGQGSQGAWLKANRYVTVVDSSYPLWRSFYQGQSKSITPLTYHVTGEYHALSGAQYVSVYDAQGKWHGYVNTLATKAAAGPQGAWLADTHYLKIVHAYSLWQSFFGRHTSAKLGLTYHTAGKYRHLNGTIYYSVYDAADRWLGYLNAAAAKIIDQAPQPGFALSAHRGVHTDAPENSLAAINAAGKAGFGLVELDVQETADHHEVLMHDQTIDRTTTGTGKVSQLTLSQIQAVALKGPNGKSTTNKVPTLAAALATAAADHLFVNLDGSKGNWQDLQFTDRVVAQLKANGLYASSFFVLSNAAVRRQFMQRYPDAKVTWLYSPSVSPEVTLQALQQYPHALFSIASEDVTPGIIALMQASGIAVHVYHVNDVAVAKRLKALGVNYLETDTLTPAQVN